MKTKENDLNIVDWDSKNPLEDGEGLLITPKVTEFNLICCDCSLTHRIKVEFTNKDNVILRFFRDDRRTAAYRRGKKPNLKEGSGKWKLTRKI